ASRARSRAHPANCCRSHCAGPATARKRWHWCSATRTSVPAAWSRPASPPPPRARTSTSPRSAPRSACPAARPGRSRRSRCWRSRPRRSRRRASRRWCFRSRPRATAWRRSWRPSQLRRHPPGRPASRRPLPPDRTRATMFHRLMYYLTDYRVLAAIGIVAAAALVYFGAQGLQAIGTWALALIVVALLAWGVVWLVRRLLARRAAKGVDEMVEDEADRAVAGAQPATRADAEVLRERMLEAVRAIKSSRIGMLRGNAALYELPWYVIIGNPAAG